MVLTTTPEVPGREIVEVVGIVTGETVMGAHIGKDFLAGIRNVIGGRSSAYEKTVQEGVDLALAEMGDRADRLGADAVVGIRVDASAIGADGSMLTALATGTAVRLG